MNKNTAFIVYMLASIAANFGFFGASANASLITLDAVSFSSSVMDSNAQTETTSTTLVPLNSQAVFTASLGDSLAITTNDWAFSSTSQLFKFDFEQTRASDTRSYANGYQTVYFTANQNVAYQIDGMYGMTGDLTIAMRVVLEDITGSIDLFDNRQTSKSTLNENFSVGGTDGDFFNDLVGNLSGTLLASHSYRFVALGFIDTESLASQLSELTTASGSISLLLGDPLAVPVPATLTLFGIGLAGLGWSRRKKA
jgi:hypothetical protein